MKEGWSYKKLGEVATFSRGLTYSKRDEVDVSDNIVLRSNNIDLLSSKLTFTELKYLHDDFEIPQDKRVKKGSIFICMSNGSKIHLGKVAYIDKDYNYAFGGFMGQITPNKDVDGLYLHHVLMSPSYKKYIKSLSEGANINNLKFKDLSEFVVGYPSLSEQRSIVARLDAAFSHIDALKAYAEKQLNEARKLFQAELTECMKPKEGWEEKKLGEVATIQNGFAFKSNLFKKEGEPIIRISNIQNECIETKDIVYFCKEDYFVNFDNYRIFPNDILIAMSGGTTGKLGINRTNSIFYQNQRIGVIRENKKVLNHFYLYYFLQTKSEESLKIAAGAAQPNLSTAQIKNFIIPIIPLSVQQAVVSHLDSLSSTIRKLEELQQKTLAECDALKQAMLREVFE